MSETPNNSDHPNPEQPTSGEQPGYWESQATPTPPPPPNPGVQFNPQSGYPSGESTPPAYPGTPYPPQPGYPQQASYPQQPGYPQQAGYPQQPAYGQPAYGQPAPGYGYPPPPGYPGYSKPDHPKATTALVVGIIGLVGGLTFCGVPLLASPFAWVIGQRAKNEIDQSPNQWGGRDRANVGMILGIIGTALLALALLGILIVVLVAANDPYAFN